MVQPFLENLHGAELVSLELIHIVIDPPGQGVLLGKGLLLMQERCFLRLGQIGGVRPGIILRHDFRPHLLKIRPGLLRVIQDVAVGLAGVHLHGEETSVSAAIHGQEVHAVGGAREHALPGMVRAEAVVGQTAEVPFPGEKGLDLLNAPGVGGGHHFGHFNDPPPVQPVKHVLVAEVAQVVREPVRLHGQGAQEGGLARALAAHQHQHQLKLAPRLEHPFHRSQHEGAQAALVVVVHLRAEEMVQGVPHPGHAIPAQGAQSVPHGVEGVVRGGDFQRPRQAALRLEPVVPLQMQLEKGQVRVADHGRFPHPGQRAVDGQAFVEQIPADVSAQQGVVGQRQDAVLKRVDHVASIVFLQRLPDGRIGCIQPFLAHGWLPVGHG